MFKEVELHGVTATLLWLHRDVAGLRHWRIIKGPTAWVLTATLERANLFECQAGARYRELLFTAVRTKGRWCFPILDVSFAASQLRATLGPPVQ